MQKLNRVPFRVIEPGDPRLALDVRPIDKVDQFVRRLSPFPRDIIARRIQQRRIPDAYYDVGPDGIPGYFDAMKRAKVSALQWGIRAALCLAFSLTLAEIGEYENYPGGTAFLANNLALCALGASLVFLAAATWHLIVAGPYRDEWQRLEAQGPYWQYKNGGYYRYTMLRSNGSYQIDPTAYDARLEADLYCVRDRAKVKQQSVTQILLALSGAVASNYAIRWSIRNFLLPEVFTLHLHWVVPLGIAALFLPRPIKNWYEAQITQSAYDRGAQFMWGAHVSDQVPEQLTRESVEKHSPHGDADFLTPDAASRGLAG